TVSTNPRVTIGNNFASTGCVTIICRGDCYVSINDDCMFATSILIRTSDEYSIIDLHTNEIINKNVTIGKHVWICDNALVLKGALIGSGSVIGARSVVTGTIPENSLCVGVVNRPVLVLGIF
ncbi:acyltransferase, partial [Escherichia coli]|nr:acyltransferase [Escherichia coli]